MSTTQDTPGNGVSPTAVLAASVLLLIVLTACATAIVITNHGDAATLERVMGPIVTGATGLLLLIRVEKVHKVVNGASARRETEAAALIAEKDQTIKDLATKP